MDEKQYPIYRFWMTMSDSGHSVGTSRMFRKELTREEQLEALRDFMDQNLDMKRPGDGDDYTIRSLGLEIVDSGVEYVRHDTWCLSWFNHYTFNIHLTDEELIESFQQFVHRKLPLHLNIDRRDPSLETYCLMGAEDTWRWKAPCRCEHCQRRGVVAIDH